MDNLYSRQLPLPDGFLGYATLDYELVVQSTQTYVYIPLLQLSAEHHSVSAAASSAHQQPAEIRGVASKVGGRTERKL
jgi:hypothetical protein